MKLSLQYPGQKFDIYAIVLDNGTCPAVDFRDRLKRNNVASYKTLRRSHVVNNNIDLALERDAREYANDPEFIAEGLAIRVVEEMLEHLEQKGLNQSWLAEKMGVSRAHISRILNAPPNMTLLTIAKIAVALEVMPDVSLKTKPRQPGAVERVPVSVSESPSDEYKGCGSPRGRK